MAPSVLMTTREVAERARIHPITLGRLVRDGKGPAITRLGGKQLVREDCFIAWIEASTDRPAQAAE